MRSPCARLESKLRDLAAGIKLVLFDVDGVLTDGTLLLTASGQEYKGFNSRDGQGIKMLLESGVEVGVVSGRKSKVVERRAAELGIHHVFQGCNDKLPVLYRLTQDLELEPMQVAFVGDDVADLPVMLSVGLAVAVSDAHPIVRQYAHWVTPNAGGKGAVRDVCDMVMQAQGTYAPGIQRYLFRAQP
jgi:3-deoxy-D-manno-octulosonate 8-phosphate phosphatase (KDO 8-P phosphatase)